MESKIINHHWIAIKNEELFFLENGKTESLTQEQVFDYQNKKRMETNKMNKD